MNRTKLRTVTAAAATAVALTGTPALAAATTGGENFSTNFTCAGSTAPAGTFTLTPNDDATSYTVTAAYARNLDVACVRTGVTVVLRLKGDVADTTIYKVNLGIFTSQYLPVPAGPRAACAWVGYVYGPGSTTPIATFHNPSAHQVLCSTR